MFVLSPKKQERARQVIRLEKRVRGGRHSKCPDLQENLPMCL